MNSGFKKFAKKLKLNNNKGRLSVDLSTYSNNKKHLPKQKQKQKHCGPNFFLFYKIDVKKLIICFSSRRSTIVVENTNVLYFYAYP